MILEISYAEMSLLRELVCKKHGDMRVRLYDEDKVVGILKGEIEFDESIPIEEIKCLSLLRKFGILEDEIQRLLGLKE